MDHKCKRCNPNLCNDPFCTKGLTDRQIKDKNRATRNCLGMARCIPTEHDLKQTEVNRIEKLPTWSR